MKLSLRPTLPLLCALLGTLLPSCDDPGSLRAVEALSRAATVSIHRQPHRGVRTVEAWIDGVHSVHRESVFDDGEGDLGIALIPDASRGTSETEALTFARAARFEHRYRDLAVDGVERILRNYDASLIAGRRPIADHSTIHLHFEPRNLGAQTVDVWSDEQSGLPLRVERRDGNDQLQSAMWYESVEIGKVTRTETDPPALPSLASVDPEKAPAFVGLKATQAPSGFELADSRILRFAFGAEVEVVRIDRFTDGIEHIIVIHGDATNGHWEIPQSVSPEMPTFQWIQYGPVGMVMTDRNGTALTAIGRAPKEILGAILHQYQ